MAWLTVVAVTGIWLYEAFTPGSLVNFPLDNPLGLGGVGGQVAEALSASYLLIMIAGTRSTSTR